MGTTTQEYNPTGTTLDYNTTALDDNVTLPPQHGVDDHSASVDLGPTAVLFVFVTCMVGAIVRTVFKRVPLPYTVLLLILGLLFGALSGHFPGIQTYTAMARMDPNTILTVFLPVLIFDSAFAMEVHTFQKASMQIIILAIPGLGIAALLTALFTKYVFTHYHWDWATSLMFGSIISATDPVAVVALLKELGTSKQLAIIIEGESLLNDGAAIVLFEVFTKLVIHPEQVTPLWVVLYFVRVAVGGPLFGFIMAKLTIFWLVNIFNDAITEITITLAATYLTYFIGQHVIGVSGVLAVVSLGVTMSADRTSISPEVEAFLHRFWEMLAYLANTLIFALVGVVITETTVKGGVDGNDAFYLFILYLAINLIRLVMIVTFAPILRNIGYGMSWQDGAIMAWSGLRGAVSLALALSVSREEELDVLIQRKVLLHTAGIVMLTLLVNGTTIKSLLNMLGMSEVPMSKRQAVASAMRALNEMTQTSMNLYKSDRFLADADWEIVSSRVILKDPYKTLDEEAELDKLTEHDSEDKCPKCGLEETDVEPSIVEMEQMRHEANLRLLKAQKTSYWKQFEHGVLSREATRRLVELVDTITDSLSENSIKVQDIKKAWEIKGFYANMKARLEHWKADLSENVIPSPNIAFLTPFYRLVMHSLFDAFIYVVIVVNVGTIIWELVTQNEYCDAEIKAIYGELFTIINHVFICIYSVECILKLLALRKHYFESNWNRFDLCILIITLIDLAVELATSGIGDECEESTSTLEYFDPKIFKFAKFFRLLRILRSLRLVKGLIPQAIGVMNRQINVQLRFGYDVGKGFVMGQEEVQNHLEVMIDNKQLVKEVRETVQRNRLTIIRELGLLQKSHPGIAVSVKTQQAARRILNNVRDKIIELRSEGVLDELEGSKLQVIVETKMKKLMKTPAVIPPPPPEKIIRNLSWVQKDKILSQYIQNNAVLVTMSEGEMLMAEGDQEGGIYVIVSGLVKVEGIVADNSQIEEIKNDPRYLEFLADSESEQDIAPETKEAFSDYLSTGNIIGEMSLLTGQPRNANICCETSTQMYHVSQEAMEGALELFLDPPSLEHRLWRVCAVRLATGILRRHFAYRNWSMEQIKIHLEKAVLYTEKRDIDGERLRSGFAKFDINSMTMMDIILIHGKVVCIPSNKELNGPCYIPNYCDALTLLPGRTETHVLFIVPRGQRLLDVGGGTKEESVTQATPSALSLKPKRSEMSKLSGRVVEASSSSSLCLRHASNLRSNLSTRISNIKFEQAASKSSLTRTISRLVSHRHIGRPSATAMRIVEVPAAVELADTASPVVTIDYVYSQNEKEGNR